MQGVRGILVHIHQNIKLLNDRALILSKIVRLRVYGFNRHCSHGENSNEDSAAVGDRLLRNTIAGVGGERDLDVDLPPPALR